MSYTDDVTQLVAAAARILVDQPDAISVTAAEVEGRVALYLRVAPNEAGKVIGKQGRTVRALRGILAAASQASGKSTTVDVENPDALRTLGQADARPFDIKPGYGLPR